MKKQPFWFGAMTTAEVKRWQKPRVVLVIAGICAALFGLQWFMPHLPIYNPFFFAWPTDNPLEAYRIFTPIFLHFSILHIAFNLSIFWFFGRQVETLFGSKALVVLIIISALISNVGQALTEGNNFGGLSGVVMAIISFVWVGSMSSKGRRLYMPNGLIGFVLVSLVLGFTGVLDQLLGPVANVAHGLGFVAGLIVWPVVSLFLPEPDKIELEE